MPDTPNGGDRRVTDFRFNKLEEELKQLRRDLNDGINNVRQDVAGLQFVRQDVYELQRTSLALAVVDAKEEASKAVADVREIAESARKLALSSLGVLTSAVVIAIIAVAVRVAFGA